MDFAFDMGIWGAAILVVGSVVYGVGVYTFGTPEYSLEWLFTAVAALIGGFVASEFVVGFRTWEPVFDGLALVPALIVGIAIGGIVAVASRLFLHETAPSRGG